MPIASLSSDAKQDDLFDNGILGKGFIKKSKDSLQREGILEQIRDTNATTYEQKQEDYWPFECALYTNIFDVISFFKGFFIDNEVDKKDNMSMFVNFNPIVNSIISVPPDMIPALGGRVKFMSKLHHLRQKFDDEHKTTENEQFYFIYDENNKLFGSKKYLIEHPSGIIVKYTDDQLVRISYNQQEEYCEYFIKKKNNLPI